MGYTADMKQIIYLEEATKRIKTSIGGTFYEGMNNLTIATPTDQALNQALGRPMPRETREYHVPTELHITVQDSSFIKLRG